MGKVDIRKIYDGGERLNRKSTIKKVVYEKKKVRKQTIEKDAIKMQLRRERGKKKEIYGWDKSNKEKNKQFS